MFSLTEAQVSSERRYGRRINGFERMSSTKGFSDRTCFFIQGSVSWKENAGKTKIKVETKQPERSGSVFCDMMGWKTTSAAKR